MRKKRTVSVAVVAAAILMCFALYFVTRTLRFESPRAKSPQQSTVDSQLAEGESVDVADVTPVVDSATKSVRQGPVVDDLPSGSAETGTKLLRVFLEGITEEDARTTTVTLTGVDSRAFDTRLTILEQRHDYVEWIQTSLNDVLETELAVDGQMGPVTRQAITTFQRQERLQENGRAGPKTEEALIRRVGSHPPAPHWPAEIRDSWSWRGLSTEGLASEGLASEGLASEFDLDPFFADVAQKEDLQVDELEVQVDHPLHVLETTRVPLSGGVVLESGQTVYQVRVRLIPDGGRPVFWPELTIAVRDAQTRAHLENVELYGITTNYIDLWQQPGPSEIYTSLGGGLSSPIVLSGGRFSDEPKNEVAGIALRPAAGDAPQLIEFASRVATDRGVIVYARAPGYAWGRVLFDVTTGANPELLLEPAATLDVRLTNVQLDGYAALETEATLYVHRTVRGVGLVWSQRLDETLKTKGLRLEGLEQGEYTVSVELVDVSVKQDDEWRLKKQPVLASQKFSLATGETRDVLLALPDPPAPTQRASLGGVVSFPAFGGPNFDGAEDVQLQLFGADFRYGEPDFTLSLAEMKPVSRALPTWSFLLEDLEVGSYEVMLRPFMTRWMLELPAGGREDVELVIPQLAEVYLDTVDAQTGERIPLRTIRYAHREVLPGQVSNGSNHVSEATAVSEGEPGRFHFWTSPGAVYVRTFGIPSGLNYGMRRENLELVAGLQPVRFELAPICALRFEFRDGEVALPRSDQIHAGLSRGIRAVDHDGRATAVSELVVELSLPGVYEISFDGIGADRFDPIPPRRVSVRSGETAEVIVELRRK